MLLHYFYTGTLRRNYTIDVTPLRKDLTIEALKPHELNIVRLYNF